MRIEKRIFISQNLKAIIGAAEEFDNKVILNKLLPEKTKLPMEKL